MSKTAELTTRSGAKLRIPNYLDGCISQIPLFTSSVLSGSATSPLHNLIGDNVDLKGVRNVVLFLVDGFGYTQWKKYSDRFEVLRLFEERGLVCPIDTVFPSSTPVALTTLQSNGSLPAAHGLIDWWLYIKEIDEIIATLPFAAMGNDERDSLLKSGLNGKVLYDGETFYEALAEKDFQSSIFLKKDYAHSVYSNLMYKGAAMIPHLDIPDLFNNLNNQLNKVTRPSFSYVYWGDIDSTGHALGLDSKDYDFAASNFFDSLEAFIKSPNRVWTDDTLFIITADHGQVPVSRETTVFLDEIAGFDELLGISPRGKAILPWGGPREVFVAVKDGLIDKALDLINDAVGDRVELIKSQDAFNAGLFGKVSKSHPDLFSRLGDIMVIPKDNYTVWYHHLNEKPFKFKAHHGGLSDRELQIPFALARAKELL